MIGRFIKLLFFCCGMIISNSITAYPIFYTCENETLSSSDKIDPQNLFDKVLLMSKKKQDQLVNSWCNGILDCIGHLKLIISFSNSSYEVAEKIFFSEVEKLKKEFDTKVNSPDLLKSILSYRQAYTELQACQNTSSLLSSADFIHNDNLLISYPYHSNYMYITGCKSINAKSCNPIHKKLVDRVIKESISMGTDPYLAIAISFMEDGAVGGLSLDPIGFMDILGCSGKQIKNNTGSSFESFGTNYTINLSLIKNSKLTNKIESFLKIAKPQGIMEGNSYYCYNNDSGSAPKVYQKEQGDSCCLQFNFKVSNKSTGDISRALTYEYINKITASEFRGKKDPAWRIQRFNGYSNLMGGAEPVPSWRLGVNYYENPGYGQQVMDYILNGLMFNPYISSQIKEQSQKTNQKWVSILCKGKNNGTFYYDSDKYFNLLKNSKRLGVIKHKYDSGADYSDLTDREKEVMNRELKETSSLNIKMFNSLKESVQYNYEDSIYDSIKVNKGDLFKKITVNPHNIWNKHKQNAKITEAEFKHVMEVWRISDDLADQIDKIHEQNIKDISEMNKRCQNIHHKYELMRNSSEDDFKSKQILYNKFFSCNKDAQTLESLSIVESIDSLKEFKLTSDSVLLDFQEVVIASLNRRLILDKKAVDLFKGANYIRLMKIYNKDQIGILNYYNERFRYEDLADALSRLRKLKGHDYNVEIKIKALYRHEMGQRESFDYQSAYEEYFDKIYSKRDTLEKTSDYSWKKLTSKQVKKMVKKIISNN